MDLWRTKTIEQSIADIEKPTHQLRKRLGAVDLTVFGVGWSSVRVSSCLPARLRGFRPDRRSRSRLSSREWLARLRRCVMRSSPVLCRWPAPRIP
jgi:hypothetical protein